MMLAVLNAVECLMREAGLFGELSVGKFPALFPQELCQLPVQIALHGSKVAKRPSRMRDDLHLH